MSSRGGKEVEARERKGEKVGFEDLEGQRRLAAKKRGNH